MPARRSVEFVTDTDGNQRAMGKKLSEKVANHVHRAVKAPAVSPPDWHKLTPIYDQQQCGDCYALASTGFLGALYTKNLLAPSADPPRFDATLVPILTNVLRNSASTDNVDTTYQTYRTTMVANGMTCNQGAEFEEVVAALAYMDSLNRTNFLCRQTLPENNFPSMSGYTGPYANTYFVQTVPGGANNYVNYPVRECDSQGGTCTYPSDLPYCQVDIGSAPSVIDALIPDAGSWQDYASGNTAQFTSTVYATEDAGTGIASWQHYLLNMDVSPILTSIVANDEASLQNWDPSTGPMALSDFDLGNQIICPQDDTTQPCAAGNAQYTTGVTDHLVLAVSAQSDGGVISADVHNSWGLPWGDNGVLHATLQLPTPCQTDSDCSSLVPAAWADPDAGIGWTVLCANTNLNQNYCVPTFTQGTMPQECVPNNSTGSVLPACPKSLAAAGGRCAPYYYTQPDGGGDYSPTAIDYCVPALPAAGITAYTGASLDWKH